MVSCSRVEHSVDFTTAGKKGAKHETVLITTQCVWILREFFCFVKPRYYSRNRPCLILDMEIRPHGCFGFLQFPVTPPFLRISTAESTRHAAIFTVMDRKKCVSLTPKFRVACGKRLQDIWCKKRRQQKKTFITSVF